ncbi:MAG: arsenite methyltransferase [Chloroflexi bacterium]|nr:arsenite methyltransferase [Chloroflexota bacterium]
MTEEELKTFIQEVYAQKAVQSEQFYPYCFAPKSALGAFAETEAMGYSRDELESIPNESVMGLGCGNPIAWAETKADDLVIDVGSGGGMDVFLASQKVGPKGKVIGIDITEEMVSKARTTAAHYGYKNVEFRLGGIEDISFESNSVDHIISNCTINLSPNKTKVLKEMFRVLKPGGKIVICDNVLEEPLEVNREDNLDAWTDCIAGALIKQEYVSAIAEAGFVDVAIVAEQEFNAGEKDIPVNVLSVTIKALKPRI